MPEAQRLIPTKINLDKAAEYLAPDEARFIKNLTAYVNAADGYGNTKEGLNSNKLKPLQSNELYVTLPLPAGENICIGTYPDRELNRLLVCIWNSNKKHLIYLINGSNRTYDIVYNNELLNFQLNPENFIATGNAWLEVLYLINPDNGEEITRSFFMFTDAFNYLRQIAVEDSIATNGFDETIYPYFTGNYNRESLINIGLPTPATCVTITEVERTAEDEGLTNQLLFNSWQFRITAIDVWGRPSEHSIISDQYIPGINDCFSSSQNLSRCLELSFDAGSPIIDKYQIEFRNGNDTQWYLDSVISLYEGSNIGAWWLRQRNAEIDFDSSTNIIKYTFCRTREKNAIPKNETNRLYNPVPISSRGLGKIAEKIGVGNNTDNFIPFPQELKDQITVTVIPPKKEAPDTRTITIYVPIYSWKANLFRTIRRDSDNDIVWGGVEGGNPKDYSQIFADKEQKGFIGYLLGSGAPIISEQVYINSFGQIVDDTTLSAETITDKKITFERFVFYDVPKGVYVFRLASHLANLSTDANYQSTSTTVWGRCPFNGANYSVDVNHREQSQELIIDVCDKDYNTLDDNKILVIADVAFGSSRAQCGYVYETNVNGYNQNPIELISVTKQTSHSETQTCQITDHNGFYWYAAEQDGRTFHFNFLYKCVSSNFPMGTGGHEMKFDNIIFSNGISIRTSIFSQEDIKFKYFFDNSCNRILVKGKVVLSDKNIGVPNVVVVLTRGQTAVTDDDGNFTIIAHDDNLNNPRKDEIILSGSVCHYSDSNDKCIQPLSVTIGRCSICSVIDRFVDAGSFELFYNAQRGLLSDGTYAIGVTGFDWLGRATYIQGLDFIHIPSIIQSQTIGVSQVQININSNAVFPSEFEYITFWITKELTIENYITWISDRIEFIDNSGNINNISPTQIKIYYASLNEFNKQNNFNTTTNWQFINTTSQLPYQNDVVQFLLNGDGKFFSKAITALVKYDQEGSYFLIDYTSDLKDLKQNALLRLVRPKNLTSETEPYYEICNIIKIKNQTAEQTEFMLNAFDTYYLYRQIPVPAPITPEPTTTSVSTATTTDNVTTTVTQTPVPTTDVIELRIFGFPFEHDAPSNFWGKGVFNGGRVNVKNPYETRLIHQNQIALSGILSSTGQLNYLNYFDDAQKTDFNVPNIGGINTFFFDMGLVFVLCQYDNFLVGYDDNLARINNDGTVQVASAANQFGKPQRKVGNNYGCQFKDKNSVVRRNGLISFVDSNKGEFVQFNYSDISSYTKGQCDAWFRLKVKTMQSQNDYYFHATFNPKTNEILVTNRKLHELSFINAERDYNAQISETVSFDDITKELRGFFGFVPEYYGVLDSDILSNQLFAFKNGLAYSFYNVNTNKSFNNFFGVQCEKIFRTVSNIKPDAKRLFLTAFVICTQEKYFSDLILTDSKQQSRLLLAAWSKGSYFYYAPFQCDLNTIADKNLPDETGKNKLMDGDKLYGSWLDIRLIGEPDKQDQYSELTDVIIFDFQQTNTGA